MIAEPIRRWSERHGWSIFIDKVIPIVAAVTLIMVSITSEVSPNVIIAKGTFAEALFYVYAAVLAWSTFSRDSRVHTLGVGLAVVCFGGRGGGFVELALDGHSSLWGAAFERALTVSLLVAWHISRTRRLATG
jgi:hypothetical protein